MVADMEKMKIYEDSMNYTCQVIKLPVMQQVSGLDNLMKVNVYGNDCLIGKDSNPNQLYLFFPTESQISHDFLSKNNLYRDKELNNDKTKVGFFEINRRVKSLKFKGIISTGFVIPVNSLLYLDGIIPKKVYDSLKHGDEFNEICEIEVCRKYVKKYVNSQPSVTKKTKIIDSIVDSRMAPQHFKTTHLLKYCNSLRFEDYIAVTYKLHGTSARYFNTLTKRNLKWYEKIAKFCRVKVVENEYNYVAGSRQVIKSVGFEELPDKNHYYASGDLWSEVGKNFFENKLNHGEVVYCEIIGKTYSGEVIQHGYSYNYEEPKVFIYRISNINPQGIEIDLPYLQMKERCNQLGINYCPELFYGTLRDFISSHYFDKMDGSIETILSTIFYDRLLEKPSILDDSIIEEGFCLRLDKYPKPEIFKIKSKLFLNHESKILDKEIDIQE